MTGKTLRPLLFALLLTCMAASGARAEPQSYPMLCRGGGQMHYELSPRQDSQVLLIQFVKGTQPAGTTAIPLGTCTWTDRGLRQDEPNVLSVKLMDAYIDAKLGADGRVYDVSARPFTSGDRGRESARQLNYLIDAVRHGRNFQVQAHRYSSGGFTGFSVTRIGP
jgi:hypothetical protein